MHYPIYRPRRMREKEALRAMIRETQLSVKDLIYPLFVVHGKGQRRDDWGIPGVEQHFKQRGVDRFDFAGVIIAQEEFAPVFNDAKRVLAHRDQQAAVDAG